MQAGLFQDTRGNQYFRNPTDLAQEAEMLSEMNGTNPENELYWLEEAAERDAIERDERDEEEAYRRGYEEHSEGHDD